MGKNLRVFLDASCWIAACLNPAGGSARILGAAQEGKIQILTTPDVLEEVRRNIEKKLTEEAMIQFQLFRRMCKPLVLPNPPEEDKQEWSSLTREKDLHVLAGAIRGEADVLVTLDRNDLLNQKVRDFFPIPIRHTTEFFNDYPYLRGGTEDDTGSPTE